MLLIWIYTIQIACDLITIPVAYMQTSEGFTHNKYYNKYFSIVFKFIIITFIFELEM